MKTRHCSSMAARARRRVAWALATVTALALQASPAHAKLAYGLTIGGTLLTFDTDAPNLPLNGVFITGLQAGETPLAIDVRPATGQLYVLGSSSRLYVLNPVTGVAAAVGGPFTPALAGGVFGFDFNPTVDRIRVVSGSGQNLRLNPDTGAVAAVDAALNPGAPHVAEVAYLNNAAGSTTTTLYGIDTTTNQLVVQNQPNDGTIAVVGPLGVDPDELVGFDIAANDNVAYAVLDVNLTTELYEINLATGAATPRGAVVGGPYRGFSMLARGVPMLALRGGTDLVRFYSATPSSILSSHTVTGLQPGETLVGIDFSPSDGLIYAVGTTSRVYIVDPMSAGATAVGAPFTPALSGTKFGVDVNPQGRYLHVISDSGQVLNLSLTSGAVAFSGGFPFNPPAADIAFSRNVDGTTSTTLYGIDAANDRLLQDPGVGPSTLVGPLGVDTSTAVGFDISPLDDVAFAALTVGGTGRLYTISRSTGAALEIGEIGGSGPVTGLTAMPLTYVFAEGSTGTFFDTDLLLANPNAGAVPVVITYLTESGRVVTHGLTLPPTSRTTISADANAQLGATAFSSTISSPTGAAIVAERTVRWDPTGYGMHTEKASTSLARTWFFAEGAQGFYQTFFLLTNPAPVANTATMTFLLENGTAVQRSYPLAPMSRRTVYAGDIAELVNRSFGTSVLFINAAGAAERAMYFGTPVFNGGHESAGVTRVATDWFLAEGATGAFFSTFILVANPGGPATVTFTYFREGGGTVTRTRTVPAESRVTINVALEDPSLATTSVATRITSDVGIVVERAMYWPFDPAQWQDAHNSFGVTGTALRWGLAEGRVGGPASFQTFVLLANPGTTPATTTVTFLRTSGAPVVKSFTVPAGARRTITTGPNSMVPELADESFGVTVVADQPIFAERALYSDSNSIVFAAGSNATATPLP